MDAGYFVGCGDVLINKLGITDPAELQEREYQIITAKTLDILDQICTNAGYAIDFNLATREEILAADTAAFAGNLAPLTTLYTKIVEKL